jgi:hypothetical protein
MGWPFLFVVRSLYAPDNGMYPNATIVLVASL